MSFWIRLLLGSGIILGGILPFDIAPDHPIALPRIQILDQRHISLKHLDGISFKEISDITYFPATRSLMLLSDKGNLYRFEATFDQRMHLRPRSAYRLHDRYGKRLRKRLRDSEGLCHDTAGQMFASFEGTPRVAQLSDTGCILHTLQLPAPLKASQNYHDPNKELEAVAWHPKYGIITAKERPKKWTKPRRHILYSLQGKQWSFPAENLPADGLTAIETMDDGTILALERSFDKHRLIITITLKKVVLDTQGNGLCHTEILARLSTEDGWILDNFEGLARVGPHRYVMISDDGNNPLEKTLLIYFEVHDTHVKPN